MSEPTRLYRSDSYPYQKISEDVELEKYIDTEGGTYLLTVMDEVGNFKLELPTDQEGKYDTIYDTFNEFQDREALFRRLDKEVFEFIQETMMEFQTLNVKDKGKELIVTMNNDRYVLKVFPSGMCKMSYPARETEFYIDNIWIDNPSLFVIMDGRLANHLIEKVKKELGKDLPKVPFLPFLKVEAKD